MVDTGLEERKVRLVEGQGQLIFTVVQQILGDLRARILHELSDDRFGADVIAAHWEPAVAEIAPRRFREMGEIEASR